MRLGLDAGGSFLKIAGIEAGRVLDLGRRPLPAGGGLEVVAAEVEQLVDRYRPEAVGVGLAGLVRVPEGRFVWGPHLAGEDVPLRSSLEQRLGCRVVVDNDANLAALAESVLGAGRGCDPVLTVVLGTGIGAGLVVGGAIYRGAGLAGEIGHMAMVEPGEVCACGLAGCWETVVSGGQLDRVAKEMLGGDAGAPDLVELAGTGGRRALAALETAGDWLGRGVAALVMMLDPEVVVVAGGASAAGDLLLEPARRSIASLVPGHGRHRSVRLVQSVFGGLAGAVGAALATQSAANGA